MALKLIYNLLIIATLQKTITASDEVSTTIEDLFPSDCGRQRLTKQGGRYRRMVNGEYTYFGEFPWMVQIINEGIFNCGAFLINSEWVMTAGHCVDEYPISSIILRIGDHNRLVNDEPLEMIERNVSKLIIHPTFDFSTIYKDGYDVALLKLSAPVEFQPHIQPICLPEGNEEWNKVGKLATVTGWGKIYDEEKLSPMLLKSTQPIIDLKSCKKSFANLEPSIGSLHDALCAGYRHGKVVICNGDSGGPLQIRRDNERYVVIGITSWFSKGCGLYDGVAVYTRVSKYVPWIRRELMQDYRSKL